MNVDRVVALLKDLEGWRAYVYDDKSPWPRSEVGRLDCRLSGGQYKVNATGGTATIGYGETSAEVIDRYWGGRITQDEALAIMRPRILGFYDGVRRCITANLTEHQWEAVTCRAYQTGAGGFCRSAVAAALNEGDIDAALAAWRKNFAHSDRSEVEIAHFLTPDEETPMDGWMPNVIHTPPNGRSGLAWKPGTAWKLVLHTTESGYRRSSGGRSNYHGHQSYPHAEISEDAIEQYLPLTVGAYALAGSSDRWGVGNGAHAIQVELVWQAGNAAGATEAIQRNLARWLTFVRQQTGMAPNVAPQGLPRRVSQDNWFDVGEWYEFEGICGHGNVPGNFDRWDPGPWPVDYVIDLSNAEMGEEPEPVQEDDMPYFGDSPDGREYGFWMVSGCFRKRLHSSAVWDEQAALAEKLGAQAPKHVGKIPVATFDSLIDVETLATRK